MRSLIVEDEFTSRKILSTLLAPYGEVHVAVNGMEAIAAFQIAYAEQAPYDLVCLDIMMPGMDGRDVLKKIRALEEQWGIGGLHGAKVIMTTALGDKESIFQAFRSGCEAYIVKPIQRLHLIEQLEFVGLLQDGRVPGPNEQSVNL